MRVLAAARRVLVVEDAQLQVVRLSVDHVPDAFRPALREQVELRQVLNPLRITFGRKRQAEGHRGGLHPFGSLPGGTRRQDNDRQDRERNASNDQER